MAHKEIDLGDDYVMGADMVSLPDSPEIWAEFLNEDEAEFLKDTAMEIKEIGDRTVEAIAKAKMEIGRKLLAARAIFPGDNEFGKWRKQEVPFLSGTETSYCMKAAKVFADHRELIESMSWTALRELAYAPQSMLDRLIESDERIEMSRKQVREAIDEERRDLTEGAEIVLVDGGDGTMIPMKEEPEPEPETVIKVGRKKFPPLSMEERWIYILTLDLPDRIACMDKLTYDAFLVFGMSPDTEIAYVNLATVNALETSLMLAYPDCESDIRRAADDLRALAEDKEGEIKHGEYQKRFIAEYFE